jgi:hypothetical protein
MPWMGFEPAISATKRPQTYVLDRAATGIGLYSEAIFKLLCENMFTKCFNFCVLERTQELFLIFLDVWVNAILLFYIIDLWKYMKRRCRIVKTPASYLGYTVFTSRLGDRLSWLRRSVIFVSPFSKFRDSTLN